MVEAQAELILIDRLVADAAVVVGGAGAGRQRIALAAARAPPDPSGRAGIVLPGNGLRACRRRPVRGRIVDGRHAAADRLGEHALPLQQRRHRRDHRAADGLPLALVVDEEERPVAANRAADDAAELVAAERRLDGIGRARRSCGRSAPRARKNSNTVPCNGVAAGLGRQVDDAAVEAAELGRRAVALDLELLDGVDVRKERHLAGLGLQHRDAVEQIFVGARPAAVDARQRRSRRGGSATPGARRPA